MGAVNGSPQANTCPAIVGPTAVGKTGLILSLAMRMPLEVISLDSRQVYHGLRIGTAQPTTEELKACPHHLIDFLSPSKKYSAMLFRQDFERVYAEIRSREAFPVLVGGAGMYLVALKEGFMEVPGNNPEILAEVRSRLEELPDKEIRDRLRQADPHSFDSIHPNDRYRSQRALEICDISGQPMSRLKARQKPDPSLGLEFPTYVLERPVEELDNRIRIRTEQMLKEGWLEETQAAMDEYPARSPGLMTIGYREIVEYLQGQISEEQLGQEIHKVTRQYAKRQRTWFRNISVAGRSTPEDPQLADTIAANFLG